jgi:hypothetical protein
MENIIKADLKAVEYELDSIGSEDTPVAGSCKYGNEHDDSTKLHGVIEEDLQHSMLGDIRYRPTLHECNPGLK